MSEPPDPETGAAPPGESSPNRVAPPEPSTIKTKRPGAGKPGALKARPGYEVGYGKPPAAKRFVKGKSGNPSGRPKGAKNKLPTLHAERMKKIILEEAYRTIKVRDGERDVTVAIAQAVMRSISVNAAKGNHRSQRLFTEMVTNVERANKLFNDEWLQTAMAYKVDGQAELARRKRLGLAHLPEMFPHPDDVKIDFTTGEARVFGPMCLEDKPEWDRLRASKIDYEEEIAELLDMIGKETDEKIIAAMREDILRDLEIVKMIKRAFGEEWGKGS